MLRRRSFLALVGFVPVVAPVSCPSAPPASASFEAILVMIGQVPIRRVDAMSDFLRAVGHDIPSTAPGSST